MSPRRVLVVGYGMAAARLAEEIRGRDPEGRHVALIIIGAEPTPAYDRVLLTAVLAGKLSPSDVALHDESWAREHKVAVRSGVAVTAVRPARHQVVLTDGSVEGYDDLVLATGSRPVLPPVTGLRQPTGGCAPGVTVFRTLGDCHRILAAAAPPGTRAAVIGGGLLGLETARGLAARGVQATVLHAAPHLMERQLDEAAARILANRLGEMGIDLRLDVHPVEWSPAERGAPGTLRLADGTSVTCDTVIVTAGARPETSLATVSNWPGPLAAAGLRTSSGVLVDDRLTTSDPAIRAIGDCAEHRGAAAGGPGQSSTVAGLVQPAWEQAAVLADLLTGADPDARYRGTPIVTRLRAEGIELASVGDPYADKDDMTETLRLEDPVHSRYGKLTLRGDQVAGAIMLGLPDAAAAVIQLFDRATPVPSNRLALLLGRALPPPGRVNAAAALPDGAVMCRCNTVTKAALIAAWRQGARSVLDLAAATRATTGCGDCADEVNGIISWLAREGGEDPGGSPPTEPLPRTSRDEVAA